MHGSRCGFAWPGEDIVKELRCQRDAGHGGAHVAEIDREEERRRYWWVAGTGEYGVNRYPQLATLGS